MESTTFLKCIPIFNTSSSSRQRGTQNASSKHKTYICYTCYKSFDYFEDLQAHISETNHKKVFNKYKRFFCKVCDEAFGSYEAYSAHLKESGHSTAHVYACTYPGCNKRFARRCELVEHIRAASHALYHGKMFEPIAFEKLRPLVTFSNDVLYYTTLTPAQMFEGYKKYVCLMLPCGESFDTRVEFNKHLEMVHNKIGSNGAEIIKRLLDASKKCPSEFPRITELVTELLSNSKTLFLPPQKFSEISTKGFSFFLY